MDLISCRNVMIYIEPEVQKILHAFHYALKPEGFLFLGVRILGSFTNLFEGTDRQQKIFPKKRAATTINEIQRRVQAAGEQQRENSQAEQPAAEQPA
jgi:two-component system CheB/CheR fusion protein